MTTVNKIVCVCGANKFNFRTKKYLKAFAKASFVQCGKARINRKPLNVRFVDATKVNTKATINQPKAFDIALHPMVAHCIGLYLSPDHSHKWFGPKHLHPEAEKAVPTNAIKTANGKAWNLPETSGKLCACSNSYFKPHNIGQFVEVEGKLYDTSELCINIAPVKAETGIGYNVKTAPKLSSLENAGVYMPDINLHKGFSFVCKMARDNLKRELVKSERKPLFAAYVKACNNYQLVCLPDQSALPFSICGGTVWDATEGCLIRFSLLVEKALGRSMTRKEGVFIKSQWQALTRNKRATTSTVRDIRSTKDKTAKFRTMGELWKQGNEAVKNFILANAKGTKASNSLGALNFDYRKEVASLRTKLKTGVIAHSEYNKQYAELKDLRKKQLEILELIASNNIRNQHKNSGAVRVVHNAAGMAPEIAATQSKAYAMDEYKVKESEAVNTITPHKPQTEDERELKRLHRK